MDASLSGLGAGTAQASIENGPGAAVADDIAGTDKEYRTEGHSKSDALHLFVCGHWGRCPLQATILVVLLINIVTSSFAAFH
eukprot:3657710-Alexandrium_andersonii.AAC.1